MRDALRQRAAGEILLAEVYPSEKYRGEKVRKYNRIFPPAVEISSLARRFPALFT
jgi:hypothetical protein